MQVETAGWGEGRSWWVELRGVLLGFGCLAVVACGGTAETQSADPTIPEENEDSETAGDDDSETNGDDDSGTTGASGTAGTDDVSAVACPCSRRPGANNSFKCARGVGESITSVVGPDGGLVSLLGQQGESSGVEFSIDVPPNSFSDDVEVRITETTDPPPADLIDYSPIYRVEPDDVAAEFPMALTVPAGGNDGVIPQTLAVYFAADADSPFEPLGDSYINAGFMQASTTRFGLFLAAAPRTAAQAECP